MRRALVALVVVVAALMPAPAAEATHTDSGYWMLSENGTVYAFGGAQHFGNGAPGVKAVDIEPTATGHGYWVLHENGTVEKFGDAPLSSTTTLSDASDRFVSMSAAPDGYGYWLFTAKGRVITVNADIISPSARKYGDMSGTTLNGPILDSVATPSGLGYWMVASDGGVFSFGDAKFYGSMGGAKLNKPVMSMVPDPDGVGYWLVASDGGIFAFQAAFYGSMGSVPLNKPVSGMVGGTGGYLMVAEDGGIFAFGNVKFHGSLGSNPPSSPVVAVAVIEAPPPPPPPAAFDWFEVYPATEGLGDFTSIPFPVLGDSINVVHMCDQNGADPSASCLFDVYASPSGEWIDGWSLEVDPNGATHEHLVTGIEPGLYYLTITSDTSALWGVLVIDHRCVANC